MEKEKEFHPENNRLEIPLKWNTTKELNVKIILN